MGISQPGTLYLVVVRKSCKQVPKQHLNNAVYYQEIWGSTA